MLEVTSLDRWVDGSRGDNPGEGERGDNPGGDAAAAVEEGAEAESGRLVKLPECPQCRTPIRRNLRYGRDTHHHTGSTLHCYFACPSFVPHRISAYLYQVVVVVVAFSSFARTLGECSIIQSPPALFFFFF